MTVRHRYVLVTQANKMATSTKIDWLYPELLSKEGLIEILLQRFVELPDDGDSISREDLLDLYYQHVIPRPQRTYRKNRRGTEMTRRQILYNKKRKITGPDYTEPPVKKATVEPSSRLLTSFEGPPAGDRLKPPPSCIDFEKKVIKLGGSRTSSDSPSPSVTSSSTTSENNPTSAGGTPRVIKLNRTPSGDAKSPTSAPETVVRKPIRLINSHLSGSGDSAQKSHNGNRDEQPMEMDSPEKKVKIKKISWP